MSFRLCWGGWVEGLTASTHQLPADLGGGEANRTVLFSLKRE